MGTGYLIIQARTANGALPLRGVRVRIRDDKGMVLYDLVTNEGGETEQVSLEAVDRRLSLDPNYTGTPYSVYDLEADAEGFDGLHIADVQIFDGEKAIQPVALIPMLESQTVPQRQEIFIGKHAVAMTEPRDQAGPLIAPMVLRHVIVPNPITIHLGTPSASASNVQVTFPDYVKVICC